MSLKPSLFRDVNDSKDTWSINAKVLRKWVVRRKVAPYQVWKLSMILIDEELARVEVNITQKGVIERYMDEPSEGTVYKFENFEVDENNQQYRVTSYPWIFKFHNHTHFEESEVKIPSEAFNFVAITDVQYGNVLDNELIDVIGFLQAFGRLQDQKREFDTIKRLNFSMADNNENGINVSLWGECAEKTYEQKTEDMEPPIVVLVRFARVNNNPSYGHLSNSFNATKVIFNPDIEEARSIMERLTQEPSGSQLFTQITNADNYTYSPESLLSFRTRISIEDVCKVDHECEVVTKVTLQKFETLYGWVYDACPCDKKPEYQPNGVLKCIKCDKVLLMTIPKYKVHYKVTDSTGKCSVIFFDRHATELLGKSAGQLKDKLHEDGNPSGFPKDLDNLAGRQVVLKLKIKEHNIKHRSSSIAVSQICVETHLVQKFTYTNGEQPTSSEQTVEAKSFVGTSDDAEVTISQLVTPPEMKCKRKKSSRLTPIDVDEIGLGEIATPKFSATKSIKNIKKEK